MLSKKDVIKILQEVKAFLFGHFKLTSGKHSDQYVEKIKIVQQPKKARILCIDLAEKLTLAKLTDGVDFIVSPAFGAMTLGSLVAEELDIQFAFTQRDSTGKMIMRSGFDLKPGSKVIIIEDITTTGGSILEVIEVLKSYNVEIVAIGLIVDRSNGKVKEEFNGVPLVALLTLDISTYEADECPLCKNSVPLIKPGSSGKKK